MKECRTCKQVKLLSEFIKDPRWPNTYKVDCRVCYNKKRRDKYNPQLRRIDGLKQLYKLTECDLHNMHAHQHGKCAICKTPISLISGISKKGKAHVDHCHTTGKVRGLLCTKCNTLLGMANDSIPILKEAVIYLERGQDD